MVIRDGLKGLPRKGLFRRGCFWFFSSGSFAWFQKKVSRLVLVCMLIWTGCVAEPPSSSQVDRLVSTMPEGERLFRLNCTTCHEVQPGGLRSMADVFPQSSHTKTEQDFTQFLRHPDVVGMTGFSPAELSDEDIRRLYRWLAEETSR